MDSTRDPFTRRMLQRAASVRKNRGGSLRCSSDDSRRKMSILQAILTDKPVKIEDVADCQIDSGTSSSEVNMFLEERQRAQRRRSFTTRDCLISRQSDRPGFYSKRQSTSSHLTRQLTSNADHENSHNLQKSSNEYADHGMKSDGRERIDKEQRSPRNFQKFDYEISKIPSKNNEACFGNNSSESRTNDNNVTDTVKALEKVKKLPRSQDRVTTDSNSNMKSKFQKSMSYDEIENSLDMTQTFNSTSLNMTKDSVTSSSYMKGFELGNVVWRGPLSAAYAKSRKKRDENYPEKRSEFRERIETNPSRFYNLEEPELVKAVHTEIFTPPKMRVELKTISNFNEPKVIDEKADGSTEDSSAHKKSGNLSVGPKSGEIKLGKQVIEKFLTVPENSDSPASRLSTEISKLDEDIKRLAFQPTFYTPENISELSPPDRIYPNLSKIHFARTGYSPKKLYQSPCSPEKDSESTDSEKPAIVGEQNRSNFGKHSTPPSGYSIQNIQDSNDLFKISKSSSTRDEMNSRIKATDFNEESSVIPASDSGGFVKNNNKMEKNDNFRPNMESTRKSSLSDLSKNTGSPGVKESTVSSITMPPDTRESLETAGNSSIRDETNLTLDATAPYNIDNFLTDALGDELYNTTMTFPPSEAHDKSISQFNASELISEERTPLQKKNKRFSKKASTSEPRPQHSGTFNRTASIYRSITRGIKKKLAPGLKSAPKSVTNDSTIQEDLKYEDKKIQALLQEANIQQTLMYQANKALTVCHSMKEFAASTEYVESERSLLIAGLRRAAALEEVQKLDRELNNNVTQQSCERGEVIIKDLRIPLKEDILQYESQTGDFVQWFVIAITHGASVWATRAVSCPVQNPRIIFNGGFLIPDLSPNFKITVSIYSLKMRRTTFNYDDKYHLNQGERLSTCPSPKKLILRKTERSLSPKEVQQIIEVSSIRTTSFVLAGMLELYLHDLSLSTPWPLTSLLQGSVLRGTIDLTLSCKLHLSVSHAGFLNHGDEAGDQVVWNRRWCVLQGQTLMFWNYPCDQEDKKPLAKIDFTNCISEEITSIDRSRCAKPRTLLIETVERRRRDLLCCDTAQDFIQWKSKLNQVVSALRDWNVINRSSAHVQVSDL